jgi:hypothetical protein
VPSGRRSSLYLVGPCVGSSLDNVRRIPTTGHLAITSTVVGALVEVKRL